MRGCGGAVHAKTGMRQWIEDSSPSRVVHNTSLTMGNTAERFKRDGNCRRCDTAQPPRYTNIESSCTSSSFAHITA